MNAALQALLTAPGRALRALGVKFTFGSGTGRGWTWSGSQAALTTEPLVPIESSIVYASVMWVCRTFPEAPLRVSRIAADGTATPLPDHDLAQLLRRPNPYYSGMLLQYGILLDFQLAGNAYLYKERSAAGRVVQLWWIPQWCIEPAWKSDGSSFLDGYLYRADGTNANELLPVEDVVHIRYGLDPLNMRKGLSPLASVLREIGTDMEASLYTAALLKNLGVPGLILRPPSAKDDQYRITQEDADWLKADVEARVSGSNRGRTLVVAQPMDITQMGYNPEQMKLTQIRRVPEERISAVTGIPAVVVGLGAGLDRSTYSNMAEAKQSAYESGIIPLQRLLTEELNTQLAGPDFGEDIVVDFDLSKVRVLQDDQNALHARIREDLKSGLLTLNESLVGLGMAEKPGGDVFYLPGAVTVTPSATVLGGGTIPAPPPAPATAAAPAWGTGTKAAPGYTAAEQRALATLWNATFEGEPEVGMLDAALIPAENGKGRTNGHGGAHG